MKPLKKLILLTVMSAALFLSTNTLSFAQTAAPPKDTVTTSSLKANDSLVIKSTDTTKVTKISVQDLTAPSDVSIFGFKLPTWLLTLLTMLLSILPAIQLVLKRIPSDVSLKIGGILGKLLDILTFFQKDVLKTPVDPGSTTTT